MLDVPTRPKYVGCFIVFRKAAEEKEANQNI